MAIVQQVALLALRPLVLGACRATGLALAEGVVADAANFLGERLSDQSQRVTRALERASDRAWRSLEIALAGESLLSWLDRADDRAFRDQVRQFLDAWAADGRVLLDEPTRAETLRELRAARKAGLLSAGNLEPRELARQAAPMARYVDPAAQLEAEWAILADIAEAVGAARYLNLARFLTLRPNTGDSLLAVAVRFFFRREIESDSALFQGLAFAQLDAMTHSLDAGFVGIHEAIDRHGERLASLLDDVRTLTAGTHAHVLDLRAEMARQGQQLQELCNAVLAALHSRQLDQRALRPTDSLSIGNEADLRQARELARRFRALPEPQRRELPALLNAVGKLEVAAGDFTSAQQDFRELAAAVSDPSARAEAEHNRFRAALEAQAWDEALDGLRQSASLDAARFAPFPMNKFEPERILGAGGFGVAFLCRNRHSGGRVVVKALRTDGLERAVADVFREAQVLEELDHPAIIRVRDCDFAPGGEVFPYLVMDYFPGATLAEHVEKHGAMSAEQLLPLARLTAEGLHAAHQRNILHRDVKPANVLVRHQDGEWRVKLIDFGLALRQSVIRSTFTSIQGLSLGNLQASVAGTIDYAAPEQLGKLPGAKVGPAADVYGFAKTCCFALFHTTQPLRKHWRAVPERLADLLEQCLAEDPSAQPGSFAEVLDRLTEPRASQREAPKVEPVPRLAHPSVDVGAAQRVFQGHLGGVLCVRFSPDGERALSGGEDKTLRLWDIASGREIRTLPGHKNAVCCLAFHPDGTRAISSSTDQTVRLWDLEFGRDAKTFDRKTNRSVTISNDGKLALTGSLYDGMISLWEISTGKELRRFKGHTDWVHSVVFSWDGRRILSGAMDNTIRFWDAESAKQLRCFNLTGGRICDIAISPDGEHAVSCGEDRLVRFWDLKSGRELLRLQGHADTVMSVAMAPDGRRVASAGHDRTVRLWDLAASRELHRFEGHSAAVHAVAFAPTGKSLISASGDGTLRLWRVPNF